MRGICSITTCAQPAKLHEVFEGIEGFNICWECGTKLLEAVEDYEMAIGDYQQWLNDE